jgi:alginate O-acetyltransferase complex protein AlgI
VVFSSVTFLFLFLPLFLAIYYSLPFRYRSAWILLASWVFYGWWRVDFLLILVGSSVMAWLVGTRIDRARSNNPRAAAVWRTAGVTIALLVLGYFKYFNFGVDTLSAILVRIGIPEIGAARVVLPVGISFFTFQIISYIVDVHRGTAPVARTFMDAAAYVSLFPQLVAGPIVRYSQVALQFRDREHSWESFSHGAVRFVIGLARKVLIADAVAPIADAAFGLASPGPATAWIGVAAYSVQIYFDFAAYSDMAIGMGRMLGFTFPENFNMPYASASVTEFWRRWHMTLSSWLRDYLYIPLGGSRVSPSRTIINLMTVMLLGGLWHGAAWSFLLWGAWHGAWLVGERLILGAAARKRGGVVARVVTLCAVLLGWVLFRAESLSGAIAFVSGMIGLGSGGADLSFLWQLSPGTIGALLLGVVIVVAEPVLSRYRNAGDTSDASNRPDRSPGRSTWATVATGTLLVAILVLSVLRVGASSYSPFLYFQF